MEQDGWREVDAAQAALLALQERTLVLLRRALDLVDLAVDASPDLREFGAELHGEASALLADVDVELANLGEAPSVPFASSIRLHPAAHARRTFTKGLRRPRHVSAAALRGCHRCFASDARGWSAGRRRDPEADRSTATCR